MRSFQDMEKRVKELQQLFGDSGKEPPNGVLVSIALWGADAPIGAIPLDRDPLDRDVVMLVLPQGFEIVRWDRKDDDPMSIEWFAYSSIDSVMARPKASWSSEYLDHKGDIRSLSWPVNEDQPAVFELRIGSASGESEEFSIKANPHRPAVTSALMELRNRWLSA